MKHTIYKFFSIGAYEKEEKWLNGMAAKGMMLTDVNGCRYVFEQDTPGKYIYRLELLEYVPSNAESIAYIKFLEDAGVEFVGAFLRWAYFRRQSHEGTFELYSDIESKIKHFKRITLIANVFSTVFICLSIISLWEAWNQYTVFLDWIRIGFSSEAYYIPYLIEGIIYGILAVFFPFIVMPIRRSLRHLMAESRLRE